MFSQIFDSKDPCPPLKEPNNYCDIRDSFASREAFKKSTIVSYFFFILIYTMQACPRAGVTINEQAAIILQFLHALHDLK